MSPARFRESASPAVFAAIDRFWADLGDRVRTARLARNWSTERLAKASGTSRWAVYLLERGEPASLELVVRVLNALGLRLDVDLVDPRKRVHIATGRAEDPVHAAMGELEVRHLSMYAFRTGVDEPYQHFQFHGRADVVAVAADQEALLHIENRTRFPNLQEMAGAYNAKKAYLAADLAARYGVRRFKSETHVIVAAWTAEVLHSLRRHPDTFRSLGPNDVAAFQKWWDGNAPLEGTSSTLVVLDPLATIRQRPWIDLETALSNARPRYQGYAELAARLGSRAPV
jgi:transcriptional regulator with XRE-family HTH domain